MSVHNLTKNIGRSALGHRSVFQFCTVINIGCKVKTYHY